ncbi:MAG: hypothetical protein V7603_5190 [Micromonosporaceae bacterium]
MGTVSDQHIQRPGGLAASDEPNDVPVVWTFRAVWPVPDPNLSSRTALGQAAEDLPNVAEQSNARLIAAPTWTVEEVEYPQRWPYAAYLVVAAAPAVPARPSPQQRPAVMAYLFDLDWSDRRIADLMGIPESLVTALYRLHRPVDTAQHQHQRAVAA